MKFACELSIQCLVDSGVREASLAGMCAKPGAGRGMMEWLCERLGGVRVKCGGGVAVSSLARSILEFGAAQSRGRATPASDTRVEGGHLREGFSKVDQLLRSNKDCMAVYSSLVAIKQYLQRIIMEETLQCGGTREQAEIVAESCHKVLALLRLSHFSLKGEFDRGQISFRAGLRGRLREVQHLLPEGVSGDILVGWCVRYFRENF